MAVSAKLRDLAMAATAPLTDLRGMELTGLTKSTYRAIRRGEVGPSEAQR